MDDTDETKWCLEIEQRVTRLEEQLKVVAGECVSNKNVILNHEHDSRDNKTKVRVDCI